MLTHSQLWVLTTALSLALLPSRSPRVSPGIYHGFARSQPCPEDLNPVTIDRLTALILTSCPGRHPLLHKLRPHPLDLNFALTPSYLRARWTFLPLSPHHPIRCRH